jgi:hypothetical protein
MHETSAHRRKDDGETSDVSRPHEACVVQMSNKHIAGVRPRLVAAALLSIGSYAPQAGAWRQQSTLALCDFDKALVRIKELPEASGIAASRRFPGRVWAHNDSGAPQLFMLDSSGSLLGRVPVAGAKVDDWEAVTVGPCAAGSCLYVGDIGDNNARRRQITVYRFPEPASADAAAQVTDVFHATYPDGPQDAEALLVTANGGMYVVTKGSTGPIAVYRFPGELRSGASVQLERVGNPHTSRKAANEDEITDGDVSPSGEWVVLRTHRSLSFYRTTRFTAGDWHPERVVDLSRLGEPQGEGVAFGNNRVIYLAGEGGGQGRPGTFARLTCTLDQ